MKLALVRGRESVQKYSSGRARGMHELEDGYESDCFSVDEYIDDDDFFKNSTFPRKRVVSAMPSTTSGHQNRKRESRDTETKKFEFSDRDIEAALTGRARLWEVPC